jgi:flagellin
MSRIVTNSSANLVYQYYLQNNQTLSSSIAKLSSGLEINSAEDDPAGLAISENERNEMSGTNAAVNVIANANNYINTTDGYLQTVNDMLGQMEQLAVSYNDSTYGSTELSDLNTEFNALVGEMNDISSQAEFNSVMLFSTNTSTLEFQVGAESNAFLSIAGAGTITSLIGAVAINNISQITAATSNVAQVRAQLGAAQVEMNYKSTANQEYSTDLSAVEGRIRDVDVAQESINYARQQMLVQSSTAMLAQANSTPQNVLSLVKG